MAESNREFVTSTVQAGVARLVLNRPPANVMHIAMLEEMEEALKALAEAGPLKALVLRAEGRMFSAGVDVADHTPERVGTMIPLFNRVCQALAEFPCPTVALVHGHALGGGCELVICCDFALMAEGARIGQPEIRLAAMAPIAALRLPMLVGPRQAARLLFTGVQLEAVEAAEIGLVDRALPAQVLAQALDDLLGQLCDMSAVALRLNKRALSLGTAGWDDGLAQMERLYLEELMATEDASEGLKAFMEKRKPAWRDR